jgi:hypothetical protein
LGGPVFVTGETAKTLLQRGHRIILPAGNGVAVVTVVVQPGQLYLMGIGMICRFPPVLRRADCT